MQEIPFSKWSPSGNTTILFPEGVIPGSDEIDVVAAAQKDDALAAEQTGFVDLGNRTLRMAGGEFCVNATRAFGALLARTAVRTDGNCRRMPDTVSFTVSVSGYHAPVTVRAAPAGTGNAWDVRADLPGLDYASRLLAPGLHAIHLPGITHLLLDEERHPFSRETAETTLISLMRTYGLDRELCVGAVWWTRQEKMYAVTPLVYVRTVNTFYLENACGSGSLALALYLTESDSIPQGLPLHIRQPGGDALSVSADPGNRTASVGGRVFLQSEGIYYHTCRASLSDEDLSGRAESDAD